MASSRDPLSEQLGSLKLKVDEADLKRAKSVMQDVTQKIVDALQEEQKYVKKPEYTGSAYEGTKINAANEFDVMIILDGTGVVSNTVTPGYVSLKPGDRSAPAYGTFLQGVYLEPEKLGRVFFGLVQKQINKLGMQSRVVVSRHGPAVMLKIDGRIDVDLVPAFSVDGHLFVAKPYKDYAEQKVSVINSVSTSLLWRQSFSLQEKDKLNGIDRCNGCRRKCLKYLKYIRERDPTLGKLTSYHFKTLLFHECDRLTKTEDWTIDKSSDRFLGMLRSLHECLQNGSLPHYYVRSLNLLDGITPVTRGNITGRVNTLINSEKARTQLLG